MKSPAKFLELHRQFRKEVSEAVVQEGARQQFERVFLPNGLASNWKYDCKERKEL